jgi:hypothetical protein
MDATVWIAIGTIGTWVLALGTIVLVLETRDSMRKQALDSERDLKVRLHLAMEDRFDSGTFAVARAGLARQVLAKAPHDEIQETVFDFFESLAILDRRRMLDDDLAWNTFSYYVTRWWAACKDYVIEERKLQREERIPQSYVQFEAFATRLYDREPENSTRTSRMSSPAPTI